MNPLECLWANVEVPPEQLQEACFELVQIRCAYIAGLCMDAAVVCVELPVFRCDSHRC